MPKYAQQPQSVHSFVPLYKALGLSLTASSSNQFLAESCHRCGGSKLYVNAKTGCYDCKSGSCRQSGNHLTFIRDVYAACLEDTKDSDYHGLRDKRGIGLQTLKRHGLVYDQQRERWLIPIKNREGQVVNLIQYSPADGSKYNLPGLPTSLYGLDHYSFDPSKIVLLCEGPFDAIALDYHLKNNRHKYDILAMPGTFKEDWAKLFIGRKVRGLFDNDEGGRNHGKRVHKLLGESRVAAELRLLKWPSKFPTGCDINDLVRDYPDINIVGFTLENSVKAVAEAKLVLRLAADTQQGERKPIDWLWPDRIRCGTYVSFSGEQGTLKSTIIRDLAARYTTGQPMPDGRPLGIEPGHVIYIHAEDDAAEIVDSFKLLRGDLNRLHTIAQVLRDDSQLNLLDHLQELEQSIRDLGCRLVIIDGQNSVVGAPDISTDMKGRFTVTNRLHSFAQRMGICLIGIRNEDTTGRALGSQSMADIARCVVRAVELPTEADGQRRFELVFKKVSDTAKTNYPPVPYTVKDLGGASRRIVWGKSTKANEFKQAFNNSRAKNRV